MTGTFVTVQSAAGPPPPGVRQVYPPPWYLDLVRHRLHAVTGGGGAAALAGAAVAMADDDDGGEEAALLALAHELVGPAAALDDLPHRTRLFILGFDVAEVRDDLRALAREVGLGGPAPVLVLEDEFLLALEVEKVVHQAGHRVCGTAARSDTAIAAAERTRPELIVADVQLADGADTGLKAVRAIRRERGEVPVVFVTGHAERLGPELPAAALVVRKPFAAAELETALWRALLRGDRGVAAAA